ncbi:MAG: hypothetical protein AUF76_01520 [Acidobacteria bacterium 13_1_20CM_2_65_9]|nr:MAG: hypothetical protein AUF76_01520 [Acidobacteria bacterium 13_1_20CM_2_65_9]
MFMRVNARCAHQERPPLRRTGRVRRRVEAGGSNDSRTASFGRARKRNRASGEFLRFTVRWNWRYKLSTIRAMWTGLFWFALLAAAGLCYPRRPRTAGALFIGLGFLSPFLSTQ